MAQYDGSIRIGTGIDTKGVKKGVQEIQKDLERLKAIQKEFLDIGGDKGSSIYKEREKDIQKLEEALKSAQQEAQKKIEIPDTNLNQLKIEVEEYAKSLKELQEQGKFFGDEDYDRVYIAWKNATDAVKAYQAELNKRTAAGQEKIAEQEAKAAERKDAAQRRAEEQAERALQKENARIQKEAEAEAKLQAAEAERQAKIEAETVEEERLAQIRENAVVGNQRIIETLERIRELKQEIADLKAAGVTEGYKDYDDRIQELERLKQEVKDYNNSVGQTKEKYRELGDIAKKALSKINSMVSKASSAIKKFGAFLKSTFLGFNKSIKDSNKSFSSMGMSLKNILKYGFGIRSLFALVNKLLSGIKEGYENLYNYNDRFKNSINSLKASTLTLKNALAAAFRPLVDIAVPYIQKVIDYMSILLNSVGQFLAAITGQKTYTKAIKQTTAALKEETKAAQGYLSSLDEINKYQTSESPATDAGGTGQMFEEVPVNSYFTDLANKVKDILKQIFTPLKEAWNREGKFVMDSWKYALGEIKDLAKSIGADFLEVWQQEKTIKIFEDILHIIGDIGLAAGNLAHNFRMAWEENETGKRILEGVRDIISVIIANIRHAADVTADWSAKLNFTPLLTAIKGWVESLVPVFDALSGIVTDFYEKVLLPLGKWTIEKGLPELFQVLTDFNNKIDWESLRAHLAEFWEHLEPFAETVGEGLILFIERVSDRLADFLNSDTFINFLHSVEEWMNSITPEDVADAIEKLIDVLLIFKVVTMGLSVISTISSIIGGLTTAFSLLTSPVGLVITAIAALAAGFAYLYTHSEGFRNFVNGVIDGVKMMIDWFKNLGTQLDVVREKVGATRSWAGASSNMGSMRLQTSPMSLATAFENVEIPRLATGAVIPANREFLAVLGDQKHGTNIEAPLETIMQANEQLLSKAMMQLGMMGNAGNSNPQTIVIKQYLDRKQVAEAVVTEGKVRQMSTGSNMFLLGTT